MNFFVTAEGTAPLSYQWYLNQTNVLAGATNTTLSLSNLQLTNAGTYTVWVTNVAGSQASSNAVLTVNGIPTNVPAIYSFSPAAAVSGATVTITGMGFSPNASDDVVYFGAESGVVVSASATNLVVAVPAGATYGPLTVTVFGLTAYSAGAFLPEFLSAGSLNSASLAAGVDVGTGSGPLRTVVGDLDGDGQPDIVVLNYYSGSVSIYRNLGSNGSLTSASFAPPVTLTVAGGGSSVFGLALGDLTGDGRLDIVVADYTLNQVSIFQNLSAPGSLTSGSFGAEVVIPVSGNPAAVAVADIDGDGQPDLITANQGNSTVSILQNLGAGGQLSSNSFGAPVSFGTGADPWMMAIADMDGDGRLDVVTVNQGDPNHKVSILRNLGMVGAITTNSLAPTVDLAGADAGETLAVGDLDGDGRPDVVVGAYNGETLAVYRNLSTPGNLAANTFAAPVVFNVGAKVHSVALADMDGDGRVDVAAVTEAPSQLVLYQNLSTPGSFTAGSLGPELVYGTGNNAVGVAIGDLNGDGRPDVLFDNFYDATLQIDQNIIPIAAAPVITSQPTNQVVAIAGAATFSVAATGTTPLSYQWYLNQTNTLLGGTNSTLVLTNVWFSDAGNYSVVVSNSYGVVTSSNAVLNVFAVPPSITTEPVSQIAFAGSPANFSITAEGTAPLSYQWYLNQTNVLAGATNATLLLAGVQFSDAGNYSVVVTNDYGSIASSNAVLTVIDSLNHFSWNPIPSPRFVNVPFAVTLKAIDPINEVFTNFNGTVVLSSTNGIPVNPPVSANFVQGQWTGFLSISQAATNLTLRADDGLGQIGLANTINVIDPPTLQLAQSEGDLFFFWPLSYTNFVLETSPTLWPAHWVPVTTPPLQIGNQFMVPVAMSATNGFYLLHYTGP